MNFKGSGKRITDYDIPRIGALIGVGEDEVHTLMDVESRGSGFDRYGRLAMLFEPLWFYRHLTPKQGDPNAAAMLGKRERALALGLAQPTRPTSYPPESYTRLEKALAIDETAALKSASWGLGQIMGFNHVAAGYRTVQEMITAFCADEANQLQAMINFIKANKLDDELRRHDWRGLARGYNGEGYERDGYHIKLANAYAKWARIPDTPWDPAHPYGPVGAPKPPQAEPPKLPERPRIDIPKPGDYGAQGGAELAPTFWGRVADLFKPKG